MDFSVGQGVQFRGDTGTVCAVSEGVVKVVFDNDPKRGKRTFSTEFGAVSASDHDPLPLSGRRKPSLVEWVDPGTGERHTCPKQYVAKLKENLGKGRDSAKTASTMLGLMSETDNETNRRHLRQAALYLKQLGVHVISFRSATGGYFIANTEEEVRTYTDEQRKLAASMFKEAESMDAITIANSQAMFDSLTC